MDQQSPNTNMPRDTVETLKQIQKQGLSISIVKSNSGACSLPSPASAESRPKQNVLPSDKTAKIIQVTPRSQTVTETKAQILQTRLTSNAETRVSSGRITTQAPFHDSKSTPTQTRPNQLAVSESKGFSPSWSGPNSSADKSQGTTSRPVVTTPVSKMQTSQARVILPDNKTPVSRNNQSMVPENKSQARITPGQRISQNQQLIDGKTQSNQERINVNPTSPPDAKVFSSQARTGQQFVAAQDNKTIPVQRVAPQKAIDIKNTNQMSASKQDIKVSQANRIAHNVKSMPEISQNKIRQNYTVKNDGKLSVSGNSPMIVENKMVNSVRMVKNVVDSSSARSTTQCKSSQMRLPSNVSGGETLTAVQTKMIYSTVKICYQSVTPENKMILQGAKVTTQASEMFQKTAAVFDMAAEPSPVGSMPARVVTPKRGAIFTSSPQKKKSLKRSATSSVEMSKKSLDGNSSNSPEDETENPAQYFKTNRTGLTITPVRSSASPMPSLANAGRMPVNLNDKDVCRLAMEKMAGRGAGQRGKSRSRGRRKYVEPVCLTLSSDDEEEHMQAHFNNFEEAFAHQAHLFPQESEEGSKSGQSSPVYQDENDPDCDPDDPEFPGVTNIPCPRSPEDTFPGSEEEEDEEREMDEMDVEEEESIGEEDEEEMEEEDMDEEEEVPPEEEDDPLDKDDMENPLDLPLRCRSVRIGSFKVHPKSNATTLCVYLTAEGICFNAPTVSDANRIVTITLKPSDVTQMFVHFGKCLPILFVLTTPSFAESVRKSLNMTENMFGYYDPTSNDEKQKKITFLIDSVTEDQRSFLRHFIPDNKIKELDQKTANEILVKSTPSQNQFVRCEIAQPQPSPQQLQHIQISPENHLISVTTLQAPVTPRPVPPPQPAIRLLTYPPPPQTGGIPITSDDLACLNEGEFLNDTIIDFYLKFIYNERLSEYNREKTHIFSSYFFPRLTHKPERARPGDEIPKNIQMRRHSQVKTWTRHVDIFSKDFIIIPVNQNVHWFLAIVCYPGLVPEASESPPECKTKSSDNVSSTDDQDENKTVKETSSSIDGTNQNSDENSAASSSSMLENEEQDSEEPVPEAPDSSTHPDKNRRRKEVPCICIFDSLNGPNRSRIVTMLREYLEIEWKMRKGTRKVFDKTTMQGYIMQCPQQMNFTDCGVYLLQYVESFFENPIPYFDSPIPNLANWFSKEKVAKKRQELKDLILSLQKKYSATAVIRNSTTVSEIVPPSQPQVLQTDNR